MVRKKLNWQRKREDWQRLFWLAVLNDEGKFMGFVCYDNCDINILKKKAKKFGKPCGVIFSG